MSNLLTIKVKEVKYSEANLGREFKVKLKIGNQISVLSFKLPCGKSKTFDKIVYQRISKEKTVSLQIITEVGETQERFIDLGLTTDKTTVHLRNKEITKHSFNVAVKGIGREKGKFAKITFLLAVSVESVIRYVADIDPNGWLLVRFDNGKKYPIPHMLKVELISIEKARAYFKILEGKYIGQIVSVGLKNSTVDDLLQKGKHRGAARSILDQDAQKLTITGLGTYNVDIDEQNPLSSTKIYDLEIPDTPHGIGELYAKDSRYSKTWFHVGHEGSRFLHVGSASAGCITVTDKTKWTEIYNFLIKSRKNPISVGEVLVK